MYNLAKEIQNKKLNSNYKLFEVTPGSADLGLNHLEVFTCDENNNIRLHTNHTTGTISQFSAKKAKVKITLMKYNPKFKVLFVGQEDGSLEVYKPSSQRENKFSLKPHFSRINHISFDSSFE